MIFPFLYLRNLEKVIVRKSRIPAFAERANFVWSKRDPRYQAQAQAQAQAGLEKIYTFSHIH